MKARIKTQKKTKRNTNTISYNLISTAWVLISTAWTGSQSSSSCVWTTQNYLNDGTQFSNTLNRIEITNEFQWRLLDINNQNRTKIKVSSRDNKEQLPNLARTEITLSLTILKADQNATNKTGRSLHVFSLYFAF